MDDRLYVARPSFQRPLALPHGYAPLPERAAGETDHLGGDGTGSAFFQQRMPIFDGNIAE